MKKEYLKLEKFKGELDGEFTKIWIATDVRGNFFVSSDLQLKQTKDAFEPDLEATKWKSISNEQHNKITEELSLVESNKIDSKPKKKFGMSM